MTLAIILWAAIDDKLAVGAGFHVTMFPHRSDKIIFFPGTYFSVGFEIDLARSELSCIIRKIAKSFQLTKAGSF